MIPKFRAKRIDMDRWVYGQYFTTPLTDENSGTTPDAGWFFLTGEPRHCIVQNCVAFVIDLKTLGQYTGLKDKNGKEIYEGDIIKNHTPKGENHSAYDEIGVVIWDKTRIIAEQKKYGKYFSIVEGHSEVIGNIYANPELLEVTP